MNKKEEQAIVEELNEQGFAIRNLKSWPAKSTYYKPDGEPMPNLPSDPWSLQRYLRRGFTLAPPVLPSAGEIGFGLSVDVVDDGGEKAGNPLKCGQCGFESKSHFGLTAHMRKHKRESQKGEK